MKDIKQTVRQFVLDNFLMGGDRNGLQDADSFLDHRVIDSTGFMELVTYLEETFGIQVLDEELIPENLDSLDAIAAYVSRKAEGCDKP
jgi:acyl carrier protein